MASFPWLEFIEMAWVYTVRAIQAESGGVSIPVAALGLVLFC